MKFNIKTDKAVTFHTEGTTTEICNAMAKAERLAKTWIESAIDTLGGKLELWKPIPWSDSEETYITHLHRNHNGDVCACIGHKQRPENGSLHDGRNWEFPQVDTAILDNTDFSWVELYKGLSGEKI